MNTYETTINHAQIQIELQWYFNWDVGFIIKRPNDVSTVGFKKNCCSNDYSLTN